MPRKGKLAKERKMLQKKKEIAAKGTEKITYLFKQQLSNETM